MENESSGGKIRRHSLFVNRRYSKCGITHLLSIKLKEVGFIFRQSFHSLKNLTFLAFAHRVHDVFGVSYSKFLGLLQHFLKLLIFNLASVSLTLYLGQLLDVVLFGLNAVGHGKEGEDGESEFHHCCKK